MNATDARDYVRAGFAELLQRLCEGTEDERAAAEIKRREQNQRALKAAQCRVIREYLDNGLPPPASPYALSITARRELGIGIDTDQPPERREEVA